MQFFLKQSITLVRDDLNGSSAVYHVMQTVLLLQEARERYLKWACQAVSYLTPQNIRQYFVRGIYKGRKKEGEKLRNYDYSTDKESNKINEQSPCYDKST